LADTPLDTGFWEAILEQFSMTIEVGKACRAGFAVLAVMADSYPTNFQEKVDKLSGASMRCCCSTRRIWRKGIGRLWTRATLIHDMWVSAIL